MQSINLSVEEKEKNQKAKKLVEEAIASGCGILEAAAEFARGCSAEAYLLLTCAMFCVNREMSEDKTLRAVYNTLRVLKPEEHLNGNGGVYSLMDGDDLIAFYNDLTMCDVGTMRKGRAELIARIIMCLGEI